MKIEVWVERVKVFIKELSLDIKSLTSRASNMEDASFVGGRNYASLNQGFENGEFETLSSSMGAMYIGHYTIDSSHPIWGEDVTISVVITRSDFPVRLVVDNGTPGSNNPRTLTYSVETDKSVKLVLTFNTIDVGAQAKIGLEFPTRTTSMTHGTVTYGKVMLEKGILSSEFTPTLEYLYPNLDRPLIKIIDRENYGAIISNKGVYAMGGLMTLATDSSIIPGSEFIIIAKSSINISSSSPHKLYKMNGFGGWSVMSSISAGEIYRFKVISNAESRLINQSNTIL